MNLRFDLKTLLFVVLVLVVLWCLVYGCKLNLEFLENQTNDAPTDKCVGLEKKACDEDTDCTWYNDSCMSKQTSSCS